MGLGLVAVSLGPRGESFALEPFLLTAPSQGKRAEGEQSEDDDDDDHYQYGGHLFASVEGTRRRTRSWAVNSEAAQARRATCAASMPSGSSLRAEPRMSMSGSTPR